MTTGDTINRLSTQRVAFLLLLAIGITLLLFWVVKGFVLTLIMAGVLAGLAHPIHAWLTGLTRGRRGLAAGLTVLLALVIVIVPALLLLGVLLHDAVEISEALQPWLEEQLQSPGGLQKTFEESRVLSKFLPYEEQILQKAGELASGAASFVAQLVVDSATGAARFFLMLFVMLYAMFVFLKDGPAMRKWAFRLTPLTDEDDERLMGTFNSVARATLKGTVVIGVIQGGLAGAAFAVAGIRGAVFWAVVMAVMSVIPAIGCAIIWVPAVVYLAVIGRMGAALGLTAWCAIVVGSVDNFLRPVLVGRDIKMPDLMVLVTTLGALGLFGAAGIVVGPVIGALFTAVWTMWGAAVAEAEGRTPAPSG
jgi:predicted PurR-regulated permease PerM